MNTLSKKLCGAVLALAILLGAGFSASAATGANGTANMGRPQVSVQFGHWHHRRYYHRYHHHYWR